jgi:hypothetical protein
MKCIIFLDIDGTLADHTERALKAGRKPPREELEAYKKWVSDINTGMETDLPISGMRDLATAMSKHMPLFYLTNRGDQHRLTTVEWLLGNNFPPAPLIMRDPHSWNLGDGEYKSAEIQKQLNVYKDHSVIMIDDCPSGEIEEVCKAKGWTFLKAHGISAK